MIHLNVVTKDDIIYLKILYIVNLGLIFTSSKTTFLMYWK